MHEMSLAESVLRIIEDEAQVRKFRRVRSVTLEIGKLAAVEPDAMRFAFAAVMRDTLAQDARLELVETAGQGCCADCGATVRMDEALALCAQCGSGRVHVTGGDRMRVLELEVE
ncbi:MAG: hydrogenase maturation nickel metallochaperone HypA [Gallionellaceae bacterium]